MTLANQQPPAEVTAVTRLSDRIITSEAAMIESDGQRMPVEILDLGLKGFGLRAFRPLTLGSKVNLAIAEGGELHTYPCEVAFSREDGGLFRVGLRIVDLDVA